MSRKTVAYAAALAVAILVPVGAWIAVTNIQENSSRAGETAKPAETERKVLYYRNPMGLADISRVPKKDAMGMDYIPVYADEASGADGVVRLSAEKVQRAGVRVAPVEQRLLIREVRGAGVVTADESRLAVVTAKFSGFVERLNVRTMGETVEAGELLLTTWVESDDLVQKMSELAAVAETDPTSKIAESNLRLFDVPEGDIAKLASGRGALRTIAFNAPLGGIVIEKPAVDGMRFAAGDVLFRIADLSTVWVIAEIAEQDLAFVRPGEAARLSLPAMPGETIKGVVDFIYPELDTATRSGRVRIVVPNADGRLKLGLFAHAMIEAPVSDGALPAIPASAIVDDGTRQIAFVAKGDGVFEPRDLELGARAGGFVEVRGGLSAGERIVVDGVFLIDAESNLQSALAAFKGGGQ